METREQAIQFLKSMYERLGAGYHPDDPMTDYFSTYDAQNMENYMQECFDILGDEVYEIGLNLAHESISSM